MRNARIRAEVVDSPGSQASLVLLLSDNNLLGRALLVLHLVGGDISSRFFKYVKIVHNDDIEGCKQVVQRG